MSAPVQTAATVVATVEALNVQRAARPKDPRPRAAGPREDIARAIVGTLPPAERRAACADVRAFLRMLHGCHVAAETAERRASSRVGAVEAGEMAERAKDLAHHAAALLGYDHTAAALCGALLGEGPHDAAKTVGVVFAAGELQEALRVLHRAQRGARGR